MASANLVELDEQGILQTSVRSTSAERGRVFTESFGFVVVALLFLALIPLFRWAAIPFDFRVSEFISRYLAVGVAASSWAAVLAAVQFPNRYLVAAWVRYRNDPVRSLIFLCLVCLLLAIYPLAVGLLFSVAALAILELHERDLLFGALGRLIFPAVYFFVGLVTVFAFNVLAVTIRFKPNYNNLLERADRVLLLGHSVQQLAHTFSAAVPSWVTWLLQVSYFGLFSQIGAALILCGLGCERRLAVRFVSTILLAYVISLSIFFAFPTHSPYYECKTHAQSSLPRNVLHIQAVLMGRAQARAAGEHFEIQPEYYIAFPCMHLAQPLIVLWFVRRWRRIFWVLAAADLVLMPAIVLLEWHYVTDLLGGILVAALAIALSEYLNRPKADREQRRNTAHDPRPELVLVKNF